MTAPPEKRNVDLAVASDVPHIVEIYYDAFEGERFRSIFPDTEGGRRWVRKAFEKSLGPRSEGGPESKLLVSRGPEGDLLHTSLPCLGAWVSSILTFR